VKLAIAVPTYNEVVNTKKLLPAIKKSLKGYPKLSTTVFVIDDNSPDGTADSVEKLAVKLKDKNFAVKVIRRKKKEGLGKAYVDGFKQILKQGFDYILQMDADLSHDPKYLPEFLDAAKDVDFVVGSRYVRGGSTPDWGLHRKLLSRGGNLYTRLFLGSQITDYTGGFNLYSSGLLRKLNLNKLEAGGYGFLIELKFKALQNSDDVAQVPIVFMDRQHGISKIPRSTIIKNLKLVPQLRFGKAK